MQQNKGFPASIKVSIILGLIFIFMGCCMKPAQTVNKGQATEQEMAVQKQPAAGTTDVKTVGTKLALGEQAVSGQSAADKKVSAAKYIGKKRIFPSVYVVKKGDSLWWIAKFRDIYNDPLLWPVLYDANKQKIKNPNKIYPGLKLQIPRAGYKPADIRTARQKAGARQPYDPPARALPPMD